MYIQIQSWSEKIASILQDIQSWSCPCSPLLLTELRLLQGSALISMSCNGALRVPQYDVNETDTDPSGNTGGEGRMLIWNRLDWNPVLDFSAFWCLTHGRAHGSGLVGPCVKIRWKNAQAIKFRYNGYCPWSRDVEAAISSTSSTSTPIASASTASASNRTWILTEPGLYLICELADKHDYQNQQLTIYKGTLLVKMMA